MKFSSYFSTARNWGRRFSLQFLVAFFGRNGTNAFDAWSAAFSSLGDCSAFLRSFTPWPIPSHPLVPFSVSCREKWEVFHVGAWVVIWTGELLLVFIKTPQKALNFEKLLEMGCFLKCFKLSKVPACPGLGRDGKLSMGWSGEHGMTLISVMETAENSLRGAPGIPAAHCSCSSLLPAP